MIKTIIIDDEPAAVNVLSMLLKKHCEEDVEIIAVTNSPQTGKTLIEEKKPELVFLDIEMPGMSGIDLLRSCRETNFRVVFITAFDNYALEAFRSKAIDYLLKPVEADDIINVVAKIKNDINSNEKIINDKLDYLHTLFSQNNKHLETRIGIGMADKIVFLNISEIMYCEAQGAYTNVYLKDGRKVMASRSLGEFEIQLSSNKFFRIHHSTLINLKYIKEFQRFDGGYIVMDNDIKLEVSQRKRKDFLEAIHDMVV